MSTETRPDPKSIPGNIAEPLPVHKACACVFRDLSGGREILVFAHPLAGWQLPKGTVEPGEALEIAALRELREESGLSLSRVIAPIGTFERHVGGGPGEPEIHQWHLFHVDAEITQETWTHIAEGSAEEDGLAFNYFWLPIPAEGALGEFYPVWNEPFALIRAYLQQAKAS